jgi:sec-independent protein translocase protein TatB
MLDLSPEKLLVLLAVGIVVLGPDKLPRAARSLARGISRARSLAAHLSEPIAAMAEPVTTNVTEPLKYGLVEPVKAGMAQPRRDLDETVERLRSTIAAHPLPETTSTPQTDVTLN